MRCFREMLGVGLWLSILAAACRETPPAPDVVARIGEEDIPYAEFQGYLEANAGEPEGDLEDRVSTALLDGFIEEYLIFWWAVDEGLVPSSADRRAGVEAITAGLASAKVSQTRVESYYQEHRDRFRRPERVHLQQILLGDRVVAEEVRAEWAAGMPFHDIVALYTQEGLLLGSDEGELAREELPLLFVDAVFGLQPGEVSEVFSADYGFHIFKVTARLPPGTPALEQIEGTIELQLQQREVATGLEQLVERARRRYNVRVFERNLPFEYTGEY